MNDSTLSAPPGTAPAATLPNPLPWDAPPQFVLTHTVLPEHLDAYAHTNNVVYLSWMERAAWAHSASLGLDFEAYRRLGAGFVARRHEMDYLLPTYVGDELHVGTWIAGNDHRVQMQRAYQIIRAADRKTVLRSLTYWVCVDMVSGKPKRMPPEFDVYRPVAGEPG